MSISFRKKLKACILNLLLFLSAALAGLGIVELGFRLFYPHPGYWHTDHDTFFEYHPTLGWQFSANKEGVMGLPHENQAPVRINSWGMRDK